MDPRRSAPSPSLLIGLALAFLAATGSAAQETAPGPGPAPASSAPRILPDEPESLIGLGLAEALAALGAPAKVFPLRGESPAQDDVVFDYGQGWSLSWYADRVWQLRFEPPYAGSVRGIFLGDPADKALSLLGEPWARDEASLVYRLPWKAYPLRLRLALSGGKVSGVMVYRSDL